MGTVVLWWQLVDVGLPSYFTVHYESRLKVSKSLPKKKRENFWHGILNPNKTLQVLFLQSIKNFNRGESIKTPSKYIKVNKYNKEK